MTNRTYTQKDGTIWEWEETKETVKALKEYQDVVLNGYQKPSHSTDLVPEKN